MEHQGIIKAGDKSIEMLCSEFQSEPTLFFTENDLVCYFYCFLRLTLPTSNVHDKNGYKHSLIYMEYPTPFRCDTSKNKFKIKNDEEQTEKGGKYQPGHYNIIVGLYRVKR